VVTATATSAAGSTSEFSASLLFGAPRGDADGDGDVDLDDVRTVLRAGGGLGTAASVPNGDVAPAPNGDGRLDILDAARILRHLANLEPQL
jgi:hypothetical protein